MVYAIIYSKENCNKAFIGESKIFIFATIADNRGYCSRGDTNKATGAHFLLPGHSLEDLVVTFNETSMLRRLQAQTLSISNR